MGINWIWGEPYLKANKNDEVCATNKDFPKLMDRSSLAERLAIKVGLYDAEFSPAASLSKSLELIFLFSLYCFH